MKKRLIILIVIFFVVLLVLGIVLKVKSSDRYEDTIQYDGKTYVLLEYNRDIFTYGYNGNEYFEVDEIYPVKHDKWDVVYFEGDLFILDKQVKEATKYYANDENYEWFIAYEKNEKEVKVPISISSKELKYLYDMDNKEKKKTVLFEEIEQFASIVKVSKDGFIYSLISLAQCDNRWYWKTEIMNDNDEEYVIVLPNTLNEKIIEKVKLKEE